ncbi:MAG: pimeloyl-ACP methyl ester carboxylesterase, partial [Glaciecola sp.]
LVLGVGPLLVPLQSTGVDPASRAYANSQFINLRGVRTHVQFWEPSGTPIATVLAYHHFYGSAQTFDAMGQLLAADGVRLVAFDRVGFGLTERVEPEGRFTGPDAPYTRDFAVEQGVELLDRLNLDKAVVMGTSMGGTTALQFAIAHPQRVAHLIPTAAALYDDSSAPPWARPILRSRWALGIASWVVRRETPKAANRERVTGAWLDPSRATQADVDAHFGFIGVDGWDRGLVYKLASDVKPDLRPEFHKIPDAGVPVTPVGGTDDPIILPKFVELLAEGVRSPPVFIECGHVVQQECPDALARLVLGIVHEHVASR